MKQNKQMLKQMVKLRMFSHMHTHTNMVTVVKCQSLQDVVPYFHVNYSGYLCHTLLFSEWSTATHTRFVKASVVQGLTGYFNCRLIGS